MTTTAQSPKPSTSWSRSGGGGDPPGSSGAGDPPGSNGVGDVPCADAAVVPPRLGPAPWAVARARHGMLTTAQAAQAGLSAPALVALVKAGVLRHPGRGLYAVDALADGDSLQWHRQLCAGALLLYPDAVLTSTSAVLAHGMPVWGVPLDVPSVMRPIRRSGGMTAFRVAR